MVSVSGRPAVAEAGSADSAYPAAAPCLTSMPTELCGEGWARSCADTVCAPAVAKVKETCREPWSDGANTTSGTAGASPSLRLMRSVPAKFCTVFPNASPTVRVATTA